jgi:hypothetical protein
VCSVPPDAFSYSRGNPNETSSFSKPTRESHSSKQSEPSRDLTPLAPGTHNLSLGVGQVFLLGSLGDRYENAIGPEVHYIYGVSDLFSFQSNFGYRSHSSGDLTIWNLDAGLRANLSYFDSLVPFANVGLGFYFPSYTLPTSRATVSALLFGMQLGSGIDLIISNTVFFGAQVNYNTMFDSAKKDSDGNMQTLGGAFLSFMIHAGITF